MASLPIYNRDGKEVGVYEISPEEFASSINRQLLHDAVVMYQANVRQGSHRTRNRSEVAGTTQKMYRQKGTGNARAGHRKSGVRRGGGHIFARRPRDYSYRLPRKSLRAATRMAVATKIADDQLVVIDELTMTEPRTREMAGILKALNLAGASTLVAIESHDVNIYKSARNIGNVTVSPISDLNALIVLRPTQMLITQAALDKLKAGAAKSPANSGAET